jgi:hypothetical protein
MIVTIWDDGVVNTKVVDSFSNEYVLHRISDVCGPFVSRVRADYENVLWEIAEKCFKHMYSKVKCEKHLVAT